MTRAESGRQMSDQNERCVVFVTVNGEEQGLKIARAVVEEKLAACASILGPVRSVYWWDGAVQDEPELLLMMKTQRSLFDKLREAVLKLHSYEVPEIIALPIVDGHAPYLSWITDSTRRP